MPMGDPTASANPLEYFLPRLVVADPQRRVYPCQGTVLHLQLSGAAPLAAVLERGGGGGAEELSRFLWACLDALLEAIDRFGGDTLELHARELTAFFPDTSDVRISVERAIACAVAMRAAIGRLATAGSGRRTFNLNGSIGIACGVLHGVLLGQPELGQQVVFTGSALEDAIRASNLAGVNGIALQPSAGARIEPDHVRCQPPLPTPALTRLEALVRAVEPVPPPAPLPAGPMPSHFLAPALSSVVAQGGPPPLYRKITTLMVAVTGIDPVASGSLEPLLAWFSRLQQVVHLYQGHITGLEVGPSTRLEVIFGAPFSHVDDEIRSLQCALALQRVARDLPAVSDQRHGVATGTAFVGIVGGHRRRQYAAVGLRVDLADQLATHAGPWEVLVDRHTVSRSGFGFDWGPPPSVPSNASVELLTARLLYGEGAYGTKLTSRSRGSLLGREPMMEELRAVADVAISGQGTLVSLVGRAGIGKSALLVWIGQMLQDLRRIPVYRGECSALVRQAPYHAWMPVIRAWLDLQADLPPEDMLVRIEQRVGSLGQDLLPRMPLLGAVTGIDIPDTPATQGLDARRRRESLHALILELFQRGHRQVPVALIFEDIHWMDDASLELLRYLGRNMGELPLFITVTRRPEEPDQSEIVPTVEGLPCARVFNVGAMGPEGLAALACRHLGGRRLSAELDRLLIVRSGGNPLFLEELTLYLRDTEQVRLDSNGVAWLVSPGSANIPHTVREVILGRVARLDEGAQMTLKAASAVGRTFNLALLQEIYPVPFELSVLIARLERMEGLDIVRRDTGAGRAAGEAASGASGRRPWSFDLPAEASFFFKHALICDTIYETLTSATRRNLHEAIGLALERRLTPENRAELVLSITEHFRRTLRTDKQRVYYREAGEISRARALNREAYDYFLAAEHLCSLAGDREGVADLLEAQVALLNLLGDREVQREAIARWKEVSEELQDDRRLADALRAEGTLIARTGDPAGGLEVLERARNLAKARHESLLEARICRQISAVYFQRGDLARSLAAAESALTLALAASGWEDVAVVQANLGTILGRMNQIEAGRIKLEDALKRAQEQGDLRWQGIFLSELGVLATRDGRYDKALKLLERAVTLKRRVGERFEEAATLNNVGHVWLVLGGYREAQEVLTVALGLARQVEARGLEGAVLENLGAMHAGLGEVMEARARLREAISVDAASGARVAQRDALERLARLELLAGDLGAAEVALAQAMALGLPQSEPLRVLSARILELKGQRDAARSLAAEVEAALEAGGGEDGEPIWLVHYHLALVYREIDSARAAKWSEAGRAALVGRAAKVEDETLREQMLQAVPEHRAVLELWRECSQTAPAA